MVKVCKHLGLHPTSHEWICRYPTLKESFETFGVCIDVAKDECDLFTPIDLEQHPEADILREQIKKGKED